MESIPILLYHQVVDGHPSEIHAVSVDNFRQQMEWLRDVGYRSVSLDGVPSVQSKDNPEHRAQKIVITFDDGYRDMLRNATPILNSIGFTATIFLVAKRIGLKNDWDTNVGSMGAKLMDASEISDLLKLNFQIGSHTCTHPDLTRILVTQAREEILKSKDTLENKFQVQVQSFSFPFSRANRYIEKTVKESGYNYSLTYLPGFRGPAGKDPFRLVRVGITAHDSLDEFSSKVLGSGRWKFRWYLRRIQNKIKG